MTTEHSTYTHEDGTQETVTLTRGPGTPTGHALLRIKHDDGKTLDCYVNTAWLHDRAAQLAQQRPEGAEDTLSLVQQQRDQAIGRVNVLSDENDDLRARAEKAERERDEARAQINDLVSVPEPCPLTPDAITDEMVERARHRFEELDREMGYMRSSWVFRQLLDAALTEPPKRPERAEDIEAALGTWKGSRLLDAGLFAEDRRDLANHIAEEMNR